MAEKKIIDRLNVVIVLLIETIDLLSQKSEITTSEKLRMARLKQLGLDNQEIGLLFNKSKREVSQQVYETKRVRKPKK